MTHRNLNIDEFDKEFHPIMNPFNDDEESELFEIRGKDFAYVQQANPRTVWTLLDADGELIIVNGYALCDRMNYIITRNEWTGEPRTITVTYES